MKTCSTAVNIFGDPLPKAFWKCNGENYNFENHRLDCGADAVSRRNCEAHEHAYFDCDQLTPCPNPKCAHDVTGHFAAMGEVICSERDCLCVDWKYQAVVDNSCHGYVDKTNSGEVCRFSKGHDGPHESVERVRRRRDAEIKRIMKGTSQ